MKDYVDPDRNVWNIERAARYCDQNLPRSADTGLLIRYLAVDLELAVTGWRLRGEEIERLAEGVDIGHRWRSYAEAWESHHRGDRQWPPSRAEFEL